MKLITFVLLFISTIGYSQRIVGVFEGNTNWQESEHTVYLETKDTVVYKTTGTLKVVTYKGTVIRPFKYINKEKQYIDCWRRTDTQEEI